MMGINKVILLGNLGKDPEVRHLEGDRMRVTFTLATNDTYKNKVGEKIVTTEWHNVVLWTPLSEIAAQYLKKGRQIYLEGKLTNRSYVDKEGQTKYTTEVVGRDLVLLGSKNEVSDSEDSKSFASPGLEENLEPDGLPF